MKDMFGMSIDVDDLVFTDTTVFKVVGVSNGNALIRLANLRYESYPPMEFNSRLLVKLTSEQASKFLNKDLLNELARRM